MDPRGGVSPRRPFDAEPLGRQDDTIKKVAYLYAKGEPQKRIAGLLSLSPSMVSRLVEPQLQIVPTGLGIKTDESWDQAVAVFGHKAAPYCLTPNVA